jgi:lipid-A-disaccharide synthase
MNILVTALEPSANLYLKSLLPYLKNKHHNLTVYGIFDHNFINEFKEINFKLFKSSDSFGVMGLLKVIPKIILGKKLIKNIISKSEFFEHILLIDAPAFNIPLLRGLRKKDKNLPISYFILPKVWAWKPKRAKIINELATNKISIFPFEDQFYSDALYFGNPLIDQISQYKNKINTKTEKIAFLAGSRTAEIKNLMPLFRHIQDKLSCYSEYKNSKFILVIPPHFSDEKIKNIYSDISEFDVMRDTHEALNQSDFAFICSGTATLEASIIGIPFILVYKTSSIEYFIGRSFIKLNYVGLANIIFEFAKLGKFHDEVLQEDLTPEKLIYLMQKITQNNSEKEIFLENANKLRNLLKNKNNQNIFKSLSELI